MTSGDRRPTRVAVVGGGIAGLTAAFRLGRDSGEDVEIDVFEATDRTGGKLWSAELAGHRVDRGADAFSARVPDAVDLCRELGLADDLVSPAERSAFLLTGGVLRRFPTGLLLGIPTDLDRLRESGIVSERGVARAAADLERPAEPPAGDTTVGALVRDRLGDEVFDQLVGPLLSGVNAGDADQLSVEAGAAQIAAAARAGSLIRGARELLSRADPQAPVFHSLRGGTGQLAEALATRLSEEGAHLHPDTRVRCIDRIDGGYRLETDGAAGPIEVDGVVVATPASVTAELLTGICPSVADALTALEYASVAVVIYRYRRSDVGHPLDGSGFLVPEDEGLLMTACSFGTSKWPHWSDGEHVLFRVSAGRAHDRRIIDLGDEELARTLRDELQPVLDLRAPPMETIVVRWDRALPQFRPGHLERVTRWKQTLADEAPGLAVAGAAYQGVGIPACIDSGGEAARRVLAARRAEGAS